MDEVSWNPGFPDDWNGGKQYAILLPRTEVISNSQMAVMAKTFVFGRRNLLQVRRLIRERENVLVTGLFSTQLDIAAAALCRGKILHEIVLADCVGMLPLAARLRPEFDPEPHSPRVL